MDTWTIVATFITGAFFGMIFLAALVAACIYQDDKRKAERRKKLHIEDVAVVSYDNTIHDH